jgi:hypothetical protein
MGDRSVIERSIHGSAPPISYKKGGRIKRIRIIKVHAGEVVLSKREVKNLDKLIHPKRKIIHKRGKRK